MKLVRALFAVCLIGLMLPFFPGPVSAHSAFKKALQKKYPDRKISCNACHVPQQDKSHRNSFGKLFGKQLADKQLTKNFKTKKGSERKAYEKDVMVPAFNKAMETVLAMTYDDLIKAGYVEGIDEKKKN